MRTPPGQPWLNGYVVVAVTNLVAGVLGEELLRFGTLLLATPLLIGWFTANSPRRDRAFWLVIGALACSWLGDWLGDQLLSPDVFVKLGLFLIGHGCYALAFWSCRRRRLRRPGPVLAYAVVIGGALAWIAPNAGTLAPAVIAYGIVLAVMAVLATGLNRIAAVGGALFVVSDLTIALTVWVLRSPSVGTDLLIMTTYLTAQVLLVAGLVRARRGTAST